MSLNYTQRCIIGLEFDIEELKVIDKEALYEAQNRDEEYHYEFMGESYEYLEDIEDKYEDMSIIIDGNSLFFGISLGETYDYGRATLIEDNIPIPTFLNEVEKLVKILPEKFHTKIEIYFIGTVRPQVRKCI